MDYTAQADAIWELAYNGNPTPFVEYMSRNIISNLSNRDLQNFDEKRKEAHTQLEKYRCSHLFAEVTDVRYLSVIFIGKDKYEISGP